MTVFGVSRSKLKVTVRSKIHFWAIFYNEFTYRSLTGVIWHTHLDLNYT